MLEGCDFRHVSSNETSFQNGTARAPVSQMSALDEPRRPSAANERKLATGWREIGSPKKGKGARDHLLTLFGFDGWLGQRKQQKRHRPTRLNINAGLGSHVPAAGPCGFRVPAAGANVDILRGRTLANFRRTPAHLTTRQSHSTSTAYRDAALGAAAVTARPCCPHHPRSSAHVLPMATRPGVP